MYVYVSVTMCAHMLVHVCEHVACVEVKRQLAEIPSFYRGFRGSQSGNSAWPQTPLFADPPHRPSVGILVTRKKADDYGKRFLLYLQGLTVLC